MCLDRSFLVCLFLLAVLACSSCFAVHCLQFFDLPGLWVDAFSCLQFIACSSLTFQVCELMCLSVWGSFCPLSHHILLPYQLCKSCQLSELLFSLAAGSLDYLDIFFDFQYHLRFLPIFLGRIFALYSRVPLRDLSHTSCLDLHLERASVLDKMDAHMLHEFFSPLSWLGFRLVLLVKTHGEGLAGRACNWASSEF